MPLQTKRLKLLALSPPQLALYLSSPEQLEEELGLTVSRVIYLERVQRAINIKLAKMAQVAEADYPWYTYWLLVVADELFGAGLAGFKGVPNSQGEVEIGYGIDPAYQRQGYMTEAVQALIDWAFQSLECKVITATDILKSNIASQRVVEKVGMRVCGETEETLSWRIEKKDFECPNLLG